jgi:6-pyruvoyltetrahydropterin/6-carboxytetrahydropterin synthase
MYEISVETTFAAGHYLRNYKGKCENPHGHNYRVRLTLKGGQLDKAGLLVDFSDVKRLLREVTEPLDHTMMNDVEPFDRLNPSAENMARYFFEQVGARLQEQTAGRVSVARSTVWETETSVATYYL